MAMNKEEQAEMQALRDEVIRLKAWRLTEPVEPDVPIPSGWKELSKGFLFNTPSRRVCVACSSFAYHSFGRDDETTTQQPKRLYSTRERAWRAMRYEYEQEALKVLVWIDAQIAAEVEANK